LHWFRSDDHFRAEVSGKKRLMWKRRKSSEVPAQPFPPELLAEAKATPGGRVYSIDAAYAPDGA